MAFTKAERDFYSKQIETDNKRIAEIERAVEKVERARDKEDRKRELKELKRFERIADRELDTYDRETRKDYW